MAAKMLTSYIAVMTQKLTIVFRNAARYAMPNATTLAAEANYARRTLDMYLNRRAPSRKAACELADALEVRADRLRQYSEQLRAAADDAGGTDGPV